MGYHIDNGAISEGDKFIGHGDYACMIQMSVLEKENTNLKNCIGVMLKENWNFSDEEVKEQLEKILEGDKK